jgi:hypothetical protein
MRADVFAPAGAALSRGMTATAVVPAGRQDVVPSGQPFRSSKPSRARFEQRRSVTSMAALITVTAIVCIRLEELIVCTPPICASASIILLTHAR